jgi:hypothetical protein
MRRQVPLTLDRPWDLHGAADETLVTAVPGGLARLDPHSGRAVCARGLDQHISAWTEALGLVWVRSSGHARDRLSALDLDTGRVMRSVELHDFHGSGVAAIDELWLATVDGNVVILRAVGALRRPLPTRSAEPSITATSQPSPRLTRCSLRQAKQAFRSTKVASLCCCKFGAA